MRIVNIADISQLEVGEPVPSIRAKLVNIYDHKAGKKKDGGDYRIQNIEVQDQSGKVKAFLADRDPIPKDWKGRMVVMSCNSGERGLTGMKVKEDEYPKGTFKKIIHVTPSAHIDLDDGNGAPAQSATAPAKQQASTPAQQAPPPAPTNGHASAPDPVKAARKRLGRSVVAMKIACDAAVYLAKQVEKDHGIQFGPEQIEKIAVHFSMTLLKEGLDVNLPTSLEAA